MLGRTCTLFSAPLSSIVIAIFILICAAGQAEGQNVQNVQNLCPYGAPVPQELRLPAKLPPGEPVEFEKQILGYLSTLAYRNLQWCEDKWVRDTGPYMNQKDAIVHPPAHLYYSPEVSTWLVNGRQGKIPDGGVIIKEQFGPAPAARYANIPENQLGCSNDRTFMIKNSAKSRDGWFWGEVWNSET